MTISPLDTLTNCKSTMAANKNSDLLISKGIYCLKVPIYVLLPKCKNQGSSIYSRANKIAERYLYKMPLVPKMRKSF